MRRECHYRGVTPRRRIQRPPQYAESSRPALEWSHVRADPVEPVQRGPALRAAGRAGGERQRQGGGLRPGRRPTARRSGPSAAERLDWGRKWDRVLDWSNPPFAKWFVGGTINAAVNCVDRHVDAGNGDKVAIHWVGEPDDDTRDITYAELRTRSARAANALTELGVQKGDRVAIYMPMIPEVVVAMLACARLGAPAHRRVRRLLRRRPRLPRHRLRGQGRSSPPTAATAAGRQRAQAGRRRGRGRSPPLVAQASSSTSSSYAAPARTSPGTTGRDVWWHDVVDAASPEHEAEMHDSEHPLYVMYTSGTTGKPKGILHTTGGYLTGTSYTHWAVFDLKDDDVYWCTADVGWVTGHSYMVYGPLANGATQVMYEGTPDAPHKGRWWEIIAEVRRHDLLHRAHGDPDLHEVGRRHPRRATTCPRSGCSARSVSRSTPRPTSGTARTSVADNGADRRHLVADRDRPDHDQPAARRHRRQARLGDEGAARHLDRRGQRRGGVGRQRQRRLPRAQASRGRRCCARCGATTSGSRRPTGRAGRASTSPATAPSSTRTATSGCSAGSTTS